MRAEPMTGDLRTLRIAVPEHVLFQELKGEVVLLNLETGDYYGLNEIGAQAWSLLRESPRLEHVLNLLVETYEVSEERLIGDLRIFLADLEAHGLVEVHDDAP